MRALVPEESVQKLLDRGLQMAEGAIGNTYHCKTADCIGFCEYDEGARLFQCQNCMTINCIVCDVRSTLNILKLANKLNFNIFR